MSDGVFIAVPYTRPHYGKFVASLLLTKMPEHVEFQQLPGYPVDEARNMLEEMFEKGEAEFLLYVDNDCTFHPDAILRLMSHDVPVICGGMYAKMIPPRPTIGKYLGKNKDGKDWYDWQYYTEELLLYLEKHGIQSIDQNAQVFEEPELFEVDGCGMHFTLIRRDVFEQINKPYFLHEGKTGAGEDFYFSKKVKEAGFPIYTDLSVHTGHLAGEEYDFGLRELLICLHIAKSGVVSDKLPWEIG